MRLFYLPLFMALMLAGCSREVNLKHSSVDDVVAAMTLEEKAHLLVGAYSSHDSACQPVNKLVAGVAGTTYPIERLGVPGVILADGPAGLRIDPVRKEDTLTYYCTHFPIGTLLACSWNMPLVHEVGAAIGQEVLDYGVDILLAPGVNILRNPLNGRNFEYYSEDPLVAGKIAAAYVGGVQSTGVGTSVKHMAANNQETARLSNDAIVSERALREIYLKPFEIAVAEANPWTIMTSYNRLNGSYTSENPQLLDDVLRQEWHYDGVVTSDWGSGSDVVIQIASGNDMIQPGGMADVDTIIAAVESGRLDEALLDRSVARVLNMIKKSPKFRGYSHNNRPDLTEHASVTRQSAAEGMVLLKNESNALPLAPEVRNVAAFGVTSYDFIAGGTGAGNVNRAYTVSLLEGLGNAGYAVDTLLSAKYIAHAEAENRRINGEKGRGFFSTERPQEMSIRVADVNAAAAANDAAIVTIGRLSGENFDRTTQDFELYPAEMDMLKKVSTAFHAAGKPVIVVLNIGGAMATAPWRHYADAILCAWQAGQEGGNSVADILSGAVNPSGKLTMTFPMALTDDPSTANFPLNLSATIGNYHRYEDGLRHEMKDVDYTNYDEDIYVGYRYYDTFDKDVAYPFGYGLSYTTFSYGEPQVNVDDKKVTVTVDVTNDGTRPGKEVVQLYASAPDRAEANKPEKELRAFAKTELLQPGETATLTMTFNKADLASYDESRGAWIAPEGLYQLLIGASSRDIRGTATVNVEGSERTVGNHLQPPLPLNRLSR